MSSTDTCVHARKYLISLDYFSSTGSIFMHLQALDYVQNSLSLWETYDNIVLFNVHTSIYISGFLNLGMIDILGLIILCGGRLTGALQGV